MNEAQPANYTPTLDDLLTRERACRRSSDWQPPTMTQLLTASSTQMGMVAYRLAPLWSWAGGPFNGLGVSDEDKLGALYNFAGALQPLLYVAAGLPVKSQGGGLPENLASMIYHPATMMYHPDWMHPEQMSLDSVADTAHEDYDRIESPAERLAQVLPNLHLSWADLFSGALAHWLDDARTVLAIMGADLNALAGAYLLATNALVPPAPSQIGSREGEFMALPADDLGLN